jgi:hypothetical protein
MNFIRSRLAVIVAIGFGAVGPASTAALDQSSAAPSIAKSILDDSRPAEERQKLAAENPAISRELVKEMIVGLESQPDLKEEYRRIPWIWRVAVAAGKRNHDDEIRRLLDVSLPNKGEKLRDWQAVVIGGGIINGIGLVGGWPAERIGSIVAHDPELQTRWEQVQVQAAVMTEDESVFKGTRYDAIRILGVGTWDHRGAQIFRYLLKGVDDELQMGAISALGDMRSPSVGQALLSGFAHYSKTNRNMALDALIHDETRIDALLDGLEDGRVAKSALGDDRIGTLKKLKDPKLKLRVEKLFGKS